MLNVTKKALCGLALVVLICPPALADPHPGADAFLDRAEAEYGLDREMVASVLSEAKFQQSIVDAMTRPAEAKPWYEYRPIFLTEKRIDGGVAFWRENQELIERAATHFGVDPQVIVAIIGVETFYGRITGSYRVIDALTTLGFYYPQELSRDRSDFFAREFLQFMVLSKEENLPLAEVTGSYAGAMGMGQFIPSSYRAYAVDFDGSGNRDLWRSTADVVASVANYLHEHGWRRGEPVVSPVTRTASADPALASSRHYKPDLRVAELTERGFVSAPEISPERRAAVLELEEEDRKAYWLVFDNFYVITRYNRSPLYAMAVHQLSEKIAAGMPQ
jgi:membrane-bound lytic murein transglycosylase B